MPAKRSWWPRTANPGHGWCRWKTARRHKRSVALLIAQSLLLDTASGWELATKVRLGKLPGAEGLLQDLPSLLQQQGFHPLAVQLHHGVHAASWQMHATQ